MDTWTFGAVRERLRGRLADPLPGLDAQLVMAPLPRIGWRPAEFPDDARRAAALLLLYPFDEDAHLALTLRTPHLPHHGGQVSLPGGAVEPDETLDETALREAGEEVGIDPAAVLVLGHLTPLHIPVSGFVLHPVVAAANRRPSFVPSVEEVARVIDVPLAALCDRSAIGMRLRQREGRTIETPYFLVDGEAVWGATAMILAEFLALLGCPPARPVHLTP
jgi:8-oxo-dGTP pyrophosphatase MutT (NUDIX family)